MGTKIAEPDAQNGVFADHFDGTAPYQKAGSQPGFNRSVKSLLYVQLLCMGRCRRKGCQ